MHVYKIQFSGENGVKMIHNSARNNGGAIAISGSLLNISGCSVKSNFALSGNGGGIYATGSIGHPVINLKSMQIFNNEASGYGGGVFIEGSLGKESSLNGILSMSNQATSKNIFRHIHAT